MSFVHAKSQECTKSELGLFSVPPTQVSLEKGHWVDHLPVSSVSDGGPITFLCPGTEDYVDLAKTILVVRAKVTKANGDDLDQDEKVGIVNNFLHSLFKQVDVFLKGKQATGTYAYRAYLETLLNYGPAAKRSQLKATMLYKDTSAKMDTADPTLAGDHANVNLGLKKRYEFSEERYHRNGGTYIPRRVYDRTASFELCGSQDTYESKRGRVLFDGLRGGRQL